MNWQRAVEDTVTGLGFELVDAEKSAGGLLRVFIDHPAAAGGTVDAVPEPALTSEFITVDDCEKVTRQLQHVLEVEGCTYERLEVSSPGLDRPLKKAADYARFTGEQVELTLKVPFKGRKKYRGTLHAMAQGLGSESGESWRLVLVDDKAPPTRAVKRAAKQTDAEAVADGGQAGDLALDFSLDEVREARLVPVVDFKGRRMPASPGVAARAGTGSDDEVDGGRIQ